MSDSKYLERFQKLVDVLKHLGTKLGEEDHAVEAILQEMAYNPLNPTQAKIIEAKNTASEQYYC
eukprot:2344754-Ditylum_brightwellii.AAC.1